MLERYPGLDVRMASGGFRFSAKVQPRASCSEIVGVMSGSLKVKLTAPPVDGAANEALIALIATELRIPKRRIAIVSGQTARTKVVEISTD